MSVDLILRQLNTNSKLGKVGKFRGSRSVTIYAIIGFPNTFSTLINKSNSVKNSFQNQGWDIVSVNPNYTYQPDRFVITANVNTQYSNADVINNARQVMSEWCAVNGFTLSNLYLSTDSGYVSGATVNGANTNQQSGNYPNYNQGSYNPNNNTINPNETNLLVSGDYYKVVKGDTLSKIASKFKTTVARLKTLNPSLNINQIYVGQAVRVKGNPKPVTDTGNTNANNNSSNSNNNSGGGSSVIDDILNGVSNIGGSSNSSNGGGGFFSSLGLGAGITTPIVLGLGALAIIVVLKK